MSPVWILVLFFVCIMVMVTAIGQIAMKRRDQASSENILVETFLRVSDVIPATPGDSGKTLKRLVAAGYRHPSAPKIYQGLKAAAAGSFAILALMISMIGSNGFLDSLLPAACAAGFGFLLPERLLDRRVKNRSRQLRSGLPPALDLLILGLEAGQSLDAAINEAMRELRHAFPDLAAELSVTQLELLASKSRSEAFKNLGTRNPEPEIRRLAQVLIDSDRFGSSLAPALRTHVRYLRIRMRQQAREAARKVGVKLVFPVFFLIFPSVMLVTLGPAVLQIFTTLTPMMTGLNP